MKIKIAAAIVGTVLIAGCTAASNPPAPIDLYAQMQAREAANDRRSTLAFPEDLVAKGIRRCGISNLNSVTVSKQTGGQWRLYVSDTYPLSQTYMMLDGRRKQGREDYGISLTAADIAALKAEKELAVNWTEWPSGGDRQEVITMTGFGVDFDRCEDFLNGRGGIEQFT